MWSYRQALVTDLQPDIHSNQLIPRLPLLLLPREAEEREELSEDGAGYALAALVFGVKGVAVADFGDIVVLRGSSWPFEGASSLGWNAGDSTFKRLLP